jgi:spore coat protein U-like protein
VNTGRTGSSGTPRSLIKTKVDSMRVNIPRHAVPVMLASFGLCLASPVRAFTSVGDMIVNADIQSACSVSASPMAFGNVVPGVDKDTDALVTAVCTVGTTYTLDLGDGVNHITTGGIPPIHNLYRRQMAAGANRLPYMVYLDATRATEIAATAAGTSAYNNLLTSTVGNGLDQTKTIYGRVVGGETGDALAGSYFDTVVVTIAF